MDYTEIGARIRRARKIKDLTQSEVAEQVGISLSFYGHIERGSRIMSVETLGSICETLDIDAHFLLWGVTKHVESLSLTDEELRIIARFLRRLSNDIAP